MLHAHFSITWPDGQCATAQIEAESAEANYPVQYTGAFSRLVDPPVKSDVAFLAFVMRETAEKSGGKFSENYTGQFDRYAGGADAL